MKIAPSTSVVILLRKERGQKRITSKMHMEGVMYLSKFRNETQTLTRCIRVGKKKTRGLEEEAHLYSHTMNVQ